MKNLGGTLFIILVCLLAFESCDTDTSGLYDIDGPDIPPATVIATISGRIVDENNDPVGSAAVTLKSGSLELEAISSQLGYFTFKNVENQGGTAFLSVESFENFRAFRRFGLVEGQDNYTEIMVKDKRLIGAIQSGQGGTLKNVDGAEIIIPSNGVVRSSGGSYNGTVAVAMTWIDPTADDLASQMVGDLSGIDIAGNTMGLATYGMLTVELLDDSGEELQLAPGSTATLSFPVPSELQASAPAIIPTWSYDEELGTWIEEGTATYTNGVYVAEVSHFSSWNVDVKFGSLEITGRISAELVRKSSNVGNLAVYVVFDDMRRVGGWLCDDGSFSFYNFPKDEVFDIEVHNDCGEVLYKEAFGPYSNDTDIGTIDIRFGGTATSMVTISGNIVDCNGEAITTGLVLVESNGDRYTFEIEQDGTFEAVVDLCKDGQARVTVFDPFSIAKEDFIISISQSVYEFPDLEVCEVSDEFLRTSIEGEVPIITTTNIEIRNFSNGAMPLTDFFAGFNDPLFNTSFVDETSVLVKFFSEGQGLTYSNQAVNCDISIEGRVFYISETDTVYITVIADPDYLVGSFEGTVSEFPTERRGIPIHGEFRIEN